MIAVRRVDMSKTKEEPVATPSPAGFYTLKASGDSAAKSDSGRWKTTPAGINADLRKVATKVGRDAFPRPFTHTVLENEAELTPDLVTLFRSRSGRTGRGLQRPVLWADGPLDLGLITAAIASTGAASPAATDVRTVVLTAHGKERWERAQDLVASLPKEAISTRNSSYDAYSGSNRERTNRAELLAENSLGRALTHKLNELIAMLPSSYRAVLGQSKIFSNQTINTELQPLATRLDKLAPLVPLLAARQQLALDSTSGWNSGLRATLGSRTTLAARLGEERADVQGALSVILALSRRTCRANNRSSPADLAGFFNLNRGLSIAYIEFVQTLLREASPGSNWVDPEMTSFVQLGTQVTAHVPFNTIDVLCRAPVEVNDAPTNITPENLHELRDKPSARWADGSSFVFFDGIEMSMSVLEGAVKAPKTLLNVRNAEQRRALLRLVGPDRLLADVSAERVNEDEFGELYKLPNSSQFVIVNNATPEPDGTVKKYILGAIGNQHKTARSAIASTWGLREEQYWPVRET